MRKRTYRLVNTSGLPTKRVGALVRFAWDHTPWARADVVLVAGETSEHVATYEKLNDGDLINIYPRVTKVFPHYYKDWRFKTAPKYQVRNIWEDILLAAAHEFQHSQDETVGNRCSEIRAEQHSLEVLRRFRGERRK